MFRTRKVVTSARFRTSESSGGLNADDQVRGISLGRRVDEAQLASGFLGKVIEQSAGRSVLDYGLWLDLAFPHVIGVFGTRGTGKSFDLGIIAESVAGMPSVIAGSIPGSTAVIFDVQDQFWTLALSPSQELPEDAGHLGALKQWGLDPAGLPDVRLWQPGQAVSTLPNLTELHIAPGQLHLDDWLAILELERYSPMGQAFQTLLREFGNQAPADLARRAIPSALLSTFQQSTIDALRWRLEAVAEHNLIQEPGIEIHELLVPGRISILLLRTLNEALRALTVSVLVRLFSSLMGRYHQARKVARRHGAPRPEEVLPDRLWAFLDEAHVIVPKEGRTAASGPIVDYVKRGRDAGLSLVFATQQPSAVDNRLMSQVDLTITHSLGFESDLTAAVGRMPTRTSVVYQRAGTEFRSLGDVIRSLDPGEAVVADAAKGRVVLGKLRPRLSAHGGNTPAVVPRT